VPGLDNVGIQHTKASPQSASWSAQPLPPTEPAPGGLAGGGSPPLPPTGSSTPNTGGQPFKPQVSAPGVTVGAWQRKTGIDPVVGWLVCTKGVNKGRDYRLHSDRNQVGRAPNMDICIEQDETITRENHCQLVYDTRGKTFSLVPGVGRNVVYVNGKGVLGAIELAAFDQIDIGEGSFRFVPFCGTGLFDWSEG
jgi:hypothetical protein